MIEEENRRLSFSAGSNPALRIAFDSHLTLSKNLLIFIF